MKSLYLKISFFVLTGLLVVRSALAQAPIAIEIVNPLGTTTTVGRLVNRLWSASIYIAAGILTIMILIGAFQILFSAGKESMYKSGRKTITYGIMGFAIILLAGGIGSIIATLLGADPNLGGNPIDAPITSFSGIMGLIDRASLWMFGILMALGVIMILVAAFIYLFSPSIKDGTTKARKALVTAVVALLIGIMAGGVSLVIQNAVGVPGSSIDGNGIAAPLPPINSFSTFGQCRAAGYSQAACQSEFGIQ